MSWRISSALLLIVALCAPASGAVYYVNGATGQNKAGWGTSMDSPWASPSYAAANISAGDTVYVYGYSVPDDTSAYYKDVVLVSDNGTFWIGVSVDGDSPTFLAAIGGVASYSQNSGISPIYISNMWIKDNGSSRAIDFQNGGGTVNIYGCVFDTFTRATAAGGSISFGTQIYVNAGPTRTAIMNISNCSFFGQNGNATFGVRQGSDGSNRGDVYLNIDSTTVSNTKNLIHVYTAEGNLGFITDVNINNSIINCDTIVSTWDVTASGGATTSTLDMINCDTFGIKSYLHKLNNSYFGTMTFTSCVNDDPLFSDTTSSRAALNYLVQSSTMNNKSTTGGLIGVPWGWSPSAATSTYRRAPFVTRWRQLLFGR